MFEANRGQPKDGAILLTDNGYRAKCAVKLIGLPEAGRKWKGVGLRHEAALQAACFMRQCIVFIRSDNGSVCRLYRKPGTASPDILCCIPDAVPEHSSVNRSGTQANREGPCSRDEVAATNRAEVLEEEEEEEKGKEEEDQGPQCDGTSSRDTTAPLPPGPINIMVGVALELMLEGCDDKNL